MDAHGLPLRAIVTAATEADYNQAGHLMAGMPAEHLIADKSYDSDAIVRKAQEQNMQAQQKPQAAAPVRQAPVPSASFGGKRVCPLQGASGVGYMLRIRERTYDLTNPNWTHIGGSYDNNYQPTFAMRIYSHVLGMGSRLWWELLLKSELVKTQTGTLPAISGERV